MVKEATSENEPKANFNRSMHSLGGKFAYWRSDLVRNNIFAQMQLEDKLLET